MSEAGQEKAFRWDTAAGILQNFVTKMGTQRARKQSNMVGERVWFTPAQLDILAQHGLVKRINGELPADAGSKPEVVASNDVAPALEQQLRDLKVRQKFRKAGTAARRQGGAVVWITCEGGGETYEPLDLSTIKRVTNLVVIDSSELSVETFKPKSDDDRVQITAGYYVDEPRRADYREPLAYRYTPSQGGKERVIHASRLIKFYGDDVPDRLRDQYQGWGAPAVEAVWGTLSSALLALDGGAEIISEMGLTVFQIDNLKEIQSGGEQGGLGSWMALVAEAKSTLRSLLLAPGQSVERLDMSVAGWSEVYDRIAQELCAEAAMPVTKLYGQAPGGLSTDDASAWRNWSARVSDYQDDQLIPAYLYLLDVLCAAKEGPCKGKRPETLDVELAPYEVPTELEEAEIANKWGSTVNTLVQMGIIDEDEARETMRRVKGMRLQEEEVEDDTTGQETLAALMAQAGEQGATQEPGAPVGGDIEKAQDAALNGAQITAAANIVSSVYQGLYPAEQGAQLLMLGNPTLTPERARAIVGAGNPQPVDQEQPVEDAMRVDPYAGIDDPKLPENVKALSPRKRAAFVEAFNSAYEESDGDEGKAFATGYAAAKRVDSMRHDYGARSMCFALMPSEEVAAAFAPLSEIPQDELHATLLYLPDVADEEVDRVLETVEAFASKQAPMRMRTSGPGTFINGDAIARIMLLEGLGLTEMRTDLKREVEDIDALGLQTHDFTAHMTLGYHDRADYPAELLAQMAMVETDEWSAGEIIAWRNGDIVAHMPLKGGEER